MENSSLRGRFSLSTTNLSSPIAESTCLNGSSSHGKFNWGDGNISSRIRNYSPAVNKTASMSRNLNGTPPKVTMSPASRIDPRTYVDIHSNGLASRIVKYHDNSARLNRSLSMGNLYNKPGQFPVVHLKKNEMQYKAKKSRNLSMTRIAAPEKSVFHGNTLSSILRSGSIVGLQKSDEEISHENRPILHPPPTENEMAPTRSVLEVLKEISRKRINSDELDGTELIKKYCKEPEFDTIPYNGQKTQSKRQREMSSSTSSNVQISPEQQVVKRRMCNYNNYIMSSLSSSMISQNKKKMLEIQSQKRTASDLVTSTKSTDVETFRSEKQRCMSSFKLENLVQSSKYTPISPLPNTPQQCPTSADDVDKTQQGLVTRRASEPAISSTKPKLTLFNKDYDEVPTKEHNEIIDPGDDGDLCGIQFVKPKKTSSLSSGGTLLMEKTKKSKLALMLSGLKGELNEEDEVDAVTNIEKQPEVTVSEATTSAVSVPSTQSTAISFGTTTTVIPTIDANSKSAIESATMTPTTTVKSGLQFNPPSAIASASSKESNGFQIPATTADSTTSNSVAPVITTAAATSTDTLKATSTTTPSLGGFSFGLNNPLVLPATTTIAATSQPSTSTTAPTLPAATTSAIILPAAVSSATPTVKPFAFGLPTTQTATSSAPSFTFGAPSTLTASLPATQTTSVVNAFGPISASNTKSTSSAPPSVFGQSSGTSQPTFTFGSLTAPNSSSTTAALATTNATPTTTSAPTFNFGAVKTSWASSTNPAPSNANPIVGIESFGGTATSISASQSTSTLTSTNSTGGFSFSGSTSTDTPKSLFGSIVPATTIPSNSSATFAFSANNKTPAQQTNPTNAFTFGSSTAVAPTAVSNPAQPSMFGSSITPVKPSNSFTFGASAPSAPLKGSFSFSSTDKPAVPTTTTGSSIGGFSFNAPAANSNTAPDPNKNIFGSAAPAAGAVKPAFNFGSAPSNPTTSNTPMFGASAIKPTNLFGATATTTPQSTPFAFGSSSGTSTNQGSATSAPNTNLFGTSTNQRSTAPAPSTNLFGAAPTATTTASGSIFGAAVPPLQQSSTFTFGSSSNTATESTKPTGGFVFGSSSSIGSNASKPAADMNKTFVFGDGNTTITPAPPGTTSLFGGNTATNGGAPSATDNKLFSFGGAGSGTASSNSTFGGNRQAVNPSPVFNFGAAASASPTPAQNGNLFAPQPTGAPSERPIRRAMRRLHK